jgi:hypothetical protein
MALAVFYSFARSGGTLINRCLGAIPGNLVLSEVNPHGAVVPVEVQARDWVGLLRPEEFDAFSRKGYGEKLRVLAETAGREGRHLVVRDWTTLNFMPRAFFEYHHPSTLLEQDLYLARCGLEFHSAVVVRRAPAVYESIVRTFDHLAHLEVTEFGASYLAYAQAVAGRPVVQFEEFCRQPQRELERLCGWLGIAYSSTFLEGFSTFDRCTGDNRLATASRAGRSRQIEVLPESGNDPAWTRASRDPACRAADEIFGYA